MSVREMGAATGIPWSTIAALERGREPRWSTLMRYLATVPGLRPADLLPSAPPQPQPTSARVHAFLRDAAALSIDRLEVMLDLRRASRPRLVTRYEGLRVLHPRVTWEQGAASLMRLAWEGSKATGRELSTPSGRARTLRLVEGESTHAFRFGGRDRLPELDCVVTTNLTEAPPSLRCAPLAPADGVTLRVLLPRGSHVGSARVRAWSHGRPGEGPAGDVARYLHPEGLQPSWDAVASELRVELPASLPAILHALEWDAKGPGMPGRGTRTPPAIGARVRRARQEAGLSQRELARRMRVSHATLVEAERHRDVRASTLEALLKALPEVPAAFLLPAREPAGRVEVREAWTWLRDLQRLEADEVRKVVRIGTCRDAQVTIHTRGLRPLGEATTPLALLGALGKASWQSHGSVLRELQLRLPPADEQRVSVRKVSVTRDRTTHELRVPPDILAHGLDWCQRTTIHDLYARSIAEAQARTGHPEEQVFVQGNSQVTLVPAKRLVVEVRHILGFRPVDPWPTCVPMHFSPSTGPDGLLERLHPGEFRFEARPGLLRIVVEWPLGTLGYGIGWRLG